MTGAAVALVVAGVMVAVAGDDGEAGSGPSAAVATTAAQEPVPTEETVTDEASATPSTSPSPARRAPRPAELVTQLRTTVDGLVRQGQLPRKTGRELDRRLREVGQRVADGDLDKAREELREFADKLADLRREGKVGEGAYGLLSAGTTQLAQAMQTR
ncbi:hypothetical protein ABGB16_16465 [Micromonospora sp. B11E3]|uniref:FIMAH domain-containing protein n=1 Tax=Micromonospora sp. B11E3 TaxID=3153562 RepID=UPI00325E3682